MSFLRLSFGFVPFWRLSQLAFLLLVAVSVLVMTSNSREMLAYAETVINSEEPEENPEEPEEKPAEESVEEKKEKTPEEKESSESKEPKEEKTPEASPKEEEKQPKKVEGAKQEEPKKEEAKQEEPKEEENKPEEPKREESKKEEPKKESIELKYEPIRLTVKLNGVFDVKEPVHVRLKSKVFSNFEVETAVKHGDFVRQGDLLVKFKSDKYEEALADKKRAVRLSEMSLREEELALEALELKFPMMKEEFELSKTIFDEEYNFYFEVEKDLIQKSFELSRKNYLASLESAQEELRQLEKMYEADDLVEETEEFILKRTRLQVEYAKLNYERNILSLQRRIDKDFPRMEDSIRREAKREEIDYKRRKETLPHAIEQAKIRLEQKQLAHTKEVENLKKLEEDRKWMAIRAPEEGVIYFGEFENGKSNGAAQIASMLKPEETAKNNTVLMTILPERPNLIRVTIPEKELHWIKKGLSATATPVAFPDIRIKATVDSINAYPGVANDYTAVFTMIVPKSTNVVPGMNTGIEILVYEKKETFLVHKDAIQRDKDSDDPFKGYVFVLDKEDKTEKVRIKTGKTDGDKIEIIEGVKEGQKILKKAEE